MRIKRDRVMYRKFAAGARREASVPGRAVNNGNKAIINRVKTIIMLRAIIKYLNFKGNTPIMIHHYRTNDKRKLILRQRCNPVEEAE